MKKLTFIIVLSTFLLLPFVAQGQDRDSVEASLVGSHLLAICPLIEYNEIRFEHVQSSVFTYGFHLSYSNDQIFPGLAGVINLRQYLSRKSAPFGFYIYEQAGLVYYYPKAYYGIYIKKSGFLYDEYDYKSTSIIRSYGAVVGCGIGYQFSLGRRKRFSIDINAGFRNCMMNHNLNNIYVANYPGSLGAIFEEPYKKGMFKGPESSLAGGYASLGFNIGYRFR
jgi:hypothetical protein